MELGKLSNNPFFTCLTTHHMAEMDENVVDDVTDTDDVTDDTTEGVTYEQAMEWKAKAERTDKAEKKIVELKRATKVEPKSDDEVYTKADATIDRFIAKNPDLEGQESELKEYLKKGITLDQAKILVEASDKATTNRKKLDSMSVSSSEVTPKSTYSKSDLEKMSQSEYNKVMELKTQGKVTIR
jgi:hypothetical protein